MRKRKRRALATKEEALSKMRDRGLDTEGVSIVCPYIGADFWVVKDDSVIGNYYRRSHELVMTEDVLRNCRSN